MDSNFELTFRRNLEQFTAGWIDDRQFYQPGDMGEEFVEANYARREVQRT
jgi:hypothetical protein